MGHDKEMPFLDHLEELRWRIIWSVLAVAIGTVVGIFLTIRFDLMEALTAPLFTVVADLATRDATFLGALTNERLFFQSLTEPFFFVLRLGMWFGIILASPVVMYHVWAFLAPALHARERKAIIPTFVLGIVLFALGVSMAYFVALPITIRFLLLFGAEWFTPILTAGSYMSMTTGLLIAFGLAFELPIVMLLLAAIGLITSAGLREKRRHAIVALALLASVVTPGDHFQVTILLLGPLVVLYEVGIFLASKIERAPDPSGSATSVLAVAAAATYKWRAARRAAVTATTLAVLTLPALTTLGAQDREITADIGIRWSTSRQVPELTVQGVVVDAKTGLGVEAVVVTLDRTVAGSLTDANGRFAFDVPETGRYELRVERIGYSVQQDSVDLDGPGLVASVGLQEQLIGCHVDCFGPCEAGVRVEVRDALTLQAPLTPVAFTVAAGDTSETVRSEGGEKVAWATLLRAGGDLGTDGPLRAEVVADGYAPWSADGIMLPTGGCVTPLTRVIRVYLLPT